MDEKNNKFSHTGENDSQFWQRIAKYGTVNGRSGENIFKGSTNGRKIVLYYLIDANIPSRGHRKNILNENFKTVGNGVSGIYSTQNFAEVFIDKSNLKPLPGTEKAKVDEKIEKQLEENKNPEEKDENDKKEKEENLNMREKKLSEEKKILNEEKKN